MDTKQAQEALTELDQMANRLVSRIYSFEVHDWADKHFNLLRSLLTKAAAGMVMVPREPTDEMFDVGCKTYDLADGVEEHPVYSIYKAMIAASESLKESE